MIPPYFYYDQTPSKSVRVYYCACVGSIERESCWRHGDPTMRILSRELHEALEKVIETPKVL